MKPITDDIVCSILAGVEERELKKSKKLRAGKMSSKSVFSTSLTHRARRKMSGVFSYVARQKAHGSETLRS